MYELITLFFVVLHFKFNFCKKELVNQYESFKRIGHVPFEIFEPLIEKVKDTQEYKQYRLDELFEEYKKMYQLFLEKPYE